MGGERTTYQPIGGIGEVEGSCLEDSTFVREHAGAQSEARSGEAWELGETANSPVAQREARSEEASKRGGDGGVAASTASDTTVAGQRGARSGEASNTTVLDVVLDASPAGQAREHAGLSLGDTLSRVVSPVANNTGSGVGVVMKGAKGGGVSSDTTHADGAAVVAEPESAASGSKQYGGRGNGCAGGGAGADSEGAAGVALHNISRFTKTEGGEGRALSTASDTTVAGREQAGAAGVALHNISRFTKTGEDGREPQSGEAWELGDKACSESASDEAGEWRPG